MAKRQRDYAAEYQRRKERSQTLYGVTYSQQRRLIKEGKAAGLEPTEVRATLRQAKVSGADPLDATARQRRIREAAFQAWRDGDGGVKGRRMQRNLDTDMFPDEKWMHYHYSIEQ